MPQIFHPLFFLFPTFYLSVFPVSPFSLFLFLLLICVEIHLNSIELLIERGLITTVLKRKKKGK